MKVVALAYNYEGLGKDTAEHPFFFFKNPDSIIGPNDTICIPKRMEVWPEAELALRIGSGRVGEDVFDAVAVANDVTARNVDGRDVHLAFSKGMGTFLPMAPWITDFDLDYILSNGVMYTNVNGVRVQTGRLNELVHSPFEAYYYIVNFMDWKPGDILLMGTCLHQHYPLRSGDVVQCVITGVDLTNNKVLEIG